MVSSAVRGTGRPNDLFSNTNRAASHGGIFKRFSLEKKHNRTFPAIPKVKNHRVLLVRPRRFLFMIGRRPASVTFRPTSARRTTLRTCRTTRWRPNGTWVAVELDRLRTRGHDSLVSVLGWHCTLDGSSVLLHRVSPRRAFGPLETY